MLCKFYGRKNSLPIAAVGAFSMVFGIVSYTAFPSKLHNYDMLMGMFTGLGAVFIVFGIVGFLQNKYLSKDKLKRKEIDLNDERNIQIRRASATIAFFSSSVLSGVMAFLFVGLGYVVPSLILIGSLYVQLIVFGVAYRHYLRKM